jgi:hypothetical protein
LTGVYPENRGGRKLLQVSNVESTMLDRHRHRQSSFTLPLSQTFDLSNACRVLLWLLFVQCHFHSATTVRAEANVTVDDGDTRITYSPPGAWKKSAETQLNYGGSHMLAQNPNATAVFNFTGESGSAQLSYSFPWLPAVPLSIPGFPL